MDDGARKTVDELKKFISDVKKERGRKISATAADEVTAEANWIIRQLGG